MIWFYWALASAFFAGLTAILAKIGVENVNSNWATAIRTTVVLVFTWSLALLSAPPAAVAHLGRRTWIFLVLSGMATGLSWVCYFRALQLGQTAQVAPIDKLSVLFVMIFAVLLLGESLTWQHWAGGLLILAGAIILASR